MLIATVLQNDIFIDQHVPLQVQVDIIIIHEILDYHSKVNKFGPPKFVIFTIS